MGDGEWTQPIGNGRARPQDGGGGRNCSQVQGPLPTRPGGAGELARAQQGAEGSISGCGKAQDSSGRVPLCLHMLKQNVSKPVSCMLHTCPIQGLVLGYPYDRAPPPRRHSHDSPSDFNWPHAKQERLPRVPGGGGRGGG